MAKTLLRSNRRAAAVLCAASVAPALLGAALITLGRFEDQPIISWFGVFLVLVGMVLLRRHLTLLILPRLALDTGNLLVYLRGIIPWRVPLEAVECFFIGQAPSRVRVEHPTGGRIDNVTVIVRLAERSATWHERPANRNLGDWKDGYITLLGTWCEPLDGDLVSQMNHRLAEMKRAKKGQKGQQQDTST